MRVISNSLRLSSCFRKKRKGSDWSNRKKKKKEEELNKKLPTYDPKNGGKSNVFFGNEPTDYRKKE